MSTAMNGLFSHTFAFLMILAVVNFSSPRELYEEFTRKDQTPEQVREIEYFPTIVAEDAPVNVSIDRQQIVPITEACFSPGENLGFHADECRTLLQELEKSDSVPFTIERIKEDKEAQRIALSYVCRAEWATARQDRADFDLESCMNPLR